MQVFGVEEPGFLMDPAMLSQNEGLTFDDIMKMYKASFVLRNNTAAHSHLYMWDENGKSVRSGRSFQKNRAHEILFPFYLST